MLIVLTGNTGLSGTSYFLEFLTTKRKVHTMNNVTLLGRLTRNPELTYASSGLPICEFSIAVNYKDTVDYIDCVCYRKPGEALAKYMGKGGQILVEGRIKQEKWTKDGKNFQRLRVVANVVTFLASPKKQDEVQEAESFEETASF